MLVSDVPMPARPKRITQASHHAVPDVPWQAPSRACCLDQSTLALISSPRIVFHQGVFSSDLSEGLQAHGVRVSVQEDGRTQVHCQKSLDDGMLLHVVYAWVAEDAPTASKLTVDYHVAPGCALSVCTHAWIQGDQAAKTQVDASVVLGAKAKLRWLYLRDHASAAWYHHEEHRLYLCEAADWDATFCDTYGALLDRSVHLLLAEAQAHATHRVLALLEGKQQHHHDVHTDHQALRRRPRLWRVMCFATVRRDHGHRPMLYRLWRKKRW
jgi:hypothetical protein